MPRKGGRKELKPTASTHNPSVFEKYSVEDAETVDILDSELATALGYTPTVDQFLSDFRVVRVPVLTADAANEAAATVGITAVFRNAGDDGYTVTLSTVADTKFVRVRVVPA